MTRAGSGPVGRSNNGQDIGGEPIRFGGLSLSAEGRDLRRMEGVPSLAP